MSFYRENIIWRSVDGTYSRGFFVSYQTGDDPEWDVEYDYEEFFWVSQGHATEEEAAASWSGANPGGYEFTEDAELAEHYDAIAERCRNASN